MNPPARQKPTPSPIQPNDPADFVPDDRAAEHLLALGISRRRFMSYCAGLASLLALPQSFAPRLAQAALSPAKPSVVYMSFQECTGCLESMVNSFAFGGGTTIDKLILDLISLDYQETLMAAAGTQAEERLLAVTGVPSYVLVVDGSVPAKAESGYFVSGERSGVARFAAAAQNAALIVAVGTCASFGGLPKANPNPTGAVSIATLMSQLEIAKPLINVSGCPPMAEVITGVILYYLASGMPALDRLGRPKVYYKDTVHQDCYRRERFEEGPWPTGFDDSASRKGGCLYMLGCKGPVTRNACSRIRWNQGTSFPMMSGHGCLGCSEPDFWDRTNLDGKIGFYIPMDNGPYDGHGGGKPCSSCHGQSSSGLTEREGRESERDDESSGWGIESNGRDSERDHD